MKYILIRSTCPPDAIHSLREELFNKITGANSGNMVYTYAVSRAIKVKDVSLRYLRDCTPITDELVSDINNNCSAYIICLADAFRKDFVPTLKWYTQLLKKLTVPCIVIGVGLRAPLDYAGGSGFSFDAVVKAFVSEVLKKSAKLGLRGENTAKYLEALGFQREKDFTVIGCPSMFTFGDDLYLPTLDPSIIDPKLSIGYSITTRSKSVERFILQQDSILSDVSIIHQLRREFLPLYLNHPDSERADKTEVHALLAMCRKREKLDQVKYFVNPMQWIQYLQTRDCMVSSRFHGSIVAILAQIPTIVIPIDSRMRELSEYHELPRLFPSDFENDPDMSLREAFLRIDRFAFAEKHKRNFRHYCDFLQENGLRTIFDENCYRRGEAPIDNNHSYRPFTTYAAAPWYTKLNRQLLWCSYKLYRIPKKLKK